MTPATLRRDLEATRPIMTICIAATCHDGGPQAIVLCADWRATTAIGTSEAALKIRTLPYRFRCLLSGAEHDALRMTSILRTEFFKQPIEDENSAKIAVERAMQARKREKVEEYIQGKYSLSYKEFLEFGKDKFPPDLFREAFFDIKNIDIGTDFIVAGFPSASEMALLLEASSDGKVKIRDDFAVAGSGTYLAQASLLNRNQNSGYDLPYSVYSVWEAKKYAENVKSVGERTLFYVMKRSGMFQLTTEGLAHMNKLHADFGPRPAWKADLDQAKHLKPYPATKPDEDGPPVEGAETPG